MFFPLDTIKTRIQSPGGFLASGGFRGIYRGVGSVGAGGAPGAAAFFVSYEALKKLLAGRIEGRGVTHMLAASGGEFVSAPAGAAAELSRCDGWERGGPAEQLRGASSSDSAAAPSLLGRPVGCRATAADLVADTDRRFRV